MPIPKERQLVNIADHEAVLADESIRAVTGVIVVLIALGKPAVGADRRESVGSKVASKGVGSQELQTVSKALAHTRGQPVIPTGALRFYLRGVARRPADQGRTLRDIVRVGGIYGYTPNWVGWTRQACLVNRALTNQVRAAATHVTDFPDQISG